MESAGKTANVGVTATSTTNKAAAATPGKSSRSVSRYTGVAAGAAVGRQARRSLYGSPVDADSSSAPSSAPTVQAQLNDAIGDGGKPLPSSISSKASASFGRSMSDVAMHTGAKAATVASNVGANAAAYGEHLFFASGGLDASSDHGQFVLMHELAHVAQSPRVGSSAQGPIALGLSSSSHEADAGSAAAHAMQGQSASVGTAPLALRGFNATGHEEMTKQAATDARIGEMGEAIYEGNWQRDFNILLYEYLEFAERPIFEVLDIAHRKEFGRPLIEEEFGTYDPIEHLDNPTGYAGLDYYEQPSSGEDTAVVDRASKHQYAMDAYDQKQKGAESNCFENRAYVAVDSRYQAAADDLDQDTIVNPSDAPAFQVDKSGFPAYLLASRTWLTQRLHVAARAGSTSTPHVSIPGSRDSQLTDKSYHVERGADHSEGARVAGEASHTLQDYFAHSNFCEIGINLLLEDKSFREQLAKQSGAVLGTNEIDTGIHDIAKNQECTPDAPESIDAAWDTNSRTTKADGSKGRHVLGTSTYNNKDALQSVKSNLFHFIDGLELLTKAPTAENSWTFAFIDWVENNPDFPGHAIVSTTLSAIGLTLRATILPKLHQALGTKAAGHLALGAASTAPDLIKSELNAGATDLAGSAMSLAGQTQTASNLHSSASTTRQTGRADAVTGMVMPIHNAHQSLELDAQIEAVVAHLSSGQGGTYALYQIASNTLPAFNISILNLPIIKPLVANIRAQAEAAIRIVFDVFKARAKLEIDTRVEAQLGSSNSGSDHFELDARETAPGGSSSTTHTAFSHTDMAKDFSSDGAERTGNEHNDHAAGSDHGHVHEGAWLAGLATEMAQRATTEVFKRLKTCWDSGVDSASVDAMDDEVKRWFSHPEDRTDTWKSLFRGTILGNTAIMNELVARTHKRLRDQ